MNQFLMEEKQLKAAFAPVDMNTAAITGARINLGKGDKVAIVVSMGTSTAATAEFTLKQHTAASGGTTANLSVANPYYHKAGAATVFTKVLPSSAAAAYDLSSLFAADGGVVVFEVLGEDLNVDGGFAYVSVDVTDSAAAKLGSGMYVLGTLRHGPGYSVTV
jgi:hypothetical protein